MRVDAAAAATQRTNTPPIASHHSCDNADPTTSPSPMATPTIRLATRLARVPETPTATGARTPIASANPSEGFCVVTSTAGSEQSAPKIADDQRHTTAGGADDSLVELASTTARA